MCNTLDLQHEDGQNLLLSKIVDEITALETNRIKIEAALYLNEKVTLSYEQREHMKTIWKC